jgi:phosphate-selective porin OprO/OprP
VALAALLLLAAATVGRAAEPTAAPAQPPPKLTWNWWWDQGLRYHLEVPLDRLWIGPDTGPITGKPLEERLALVGRVGGRIQVDAAGYAATRGLEEVPGGIALRRLRFGTRGDFYLLKQVSYAFDLELQERELQVGDVYLWLKKVPIIGRFKIGNFSPSVTLESVTGSRDTVFMESGLPVLAFAPGRSAGIEIGAPVLGERVTWALGAFRTIQTPVVGDQSKAGARATGRVTWLVEDARVSPRLTHLGASASILVSPEDVRYRARPESFLAPTLVDTGALRANDSSIVGIEFASIRGPWLVMSEALVTAVREQRDVVLWGAYVFVSRFLTDDAQPYDRGDGSLARFEPARPFSWTNRTWGGVRTALRLSHLDLTDATIQGGRETNVTANLSWYLGRYMVLKLEYVFAAIRDRPDEGDLHAFQTRFQFDFY